VPVRAEQPQFAILASLSGLTEIPDPPRLRPRESDHRTASMVVEALHVPPGLQVVVVHPGARVPEKQWPQSAFFETMERMSREQPTAFLVVRDPNEILHRQTTWIDGRSWLAELPPLELGAFAAVLARADLLLGNDSAPAHVAAAVGTPVVVVFLSGEDPRRWGPPGKDSGLVRGEPGYPPTPVEVARRCLDVLRGQRWVSTS
jgi:ADP-heptose:LPS heptosyltransferase